MLLFYNYLFSNIIKKIIVVFMTRFMIGFRILMRFSVMDMLVSLICNFFKKTTYVLQDYCPRKYAKDSFTVFSLLLANIFQAIEIKSNLSHLFLFFKYPLLGLNFSIALNDLVDHNCFGSQSP